MGSPLSETGNNPAHGQAYELANGQVIINTYQVIAPLGKGGMGSVYRVHHRFLQKDLAMKTLRTDQVNESSWRRFQTEAQAIARLDHPNIVRIFDMGMIDNAQPFYTMEILTGQSLDETIRRFPLTAGQAIAVFKQVCSALSFAHDRGIVHRDIKPANIVVDPPDEQHPLSVKVVDFGIAKLTDQNNGQGLTKVGEVCGSPLYMSPEQAAGLKVDHRTDIYSLGCTFFEALTGRPPFKGRTAIDTMMMHQNAPPPSLRDARPDLSFPDGLPQIIDRMLAKKPDSRYQSANDIIQDLREVERAIGTGTSVTLERLQATSQRFLADPDLERDRITLTFDNPQERRKKPLDFSILHRSAPVADYSPDEDLQDQAEDDNQYDHDYDRVRISTQAESNDTNKWLAAVLIGIGALVIGALCAVAAFYFTPTKMANIKVNTDEQSALMTVATANVPENGPARNFWRARPANAPFRLTNDEAEEAGFRHPSRFRVYQFFDSASESLGRISINDQMHDRSAEGLIGIPANASVNFHCSDFLMRNQKLFARFLPTDIQSIAFPAGHRADNDTVRKISHLADLRRINLRDTEADDRIVPILDKFPRLEALQLTGSYITGTGLARMQNLKSLNEISIAHINDKNALLEALYGSRHINTLTLVGCSFTRDDMQKLANLETLEFIHLNHCEIPQCDLSMLLKLRRLKHLDLTGCNTSPIIIPTILQMRGLRILELSCANWPAEKVMELGKEMKRRGVEMRADHLFHRKRNARGGILNVSEEKQNDLKEFFSGQ